MDDDEEQQPQGTEDGGDDQGSSTDRPVIQTEWLKKSLHPEDVETMTDNPSDREESGNG